MLAVTLALSSGLLLAPPAEAASAARPYDFNGDGYLELVVGAPGLQVGSVKGAGGVVVLPASARGLSLTERVISQSSRGVPGASETDDGFGHAVASADFDRDGYADLAIGQPGENEGAGGVTVIHGSSRGLDTSRSRRVNPTASTAGDPSSRPGFGAALVAGDLDHDGFADLAVGAPNADRNTDEEFLVPSGRVSILSGGSTGLSTADPVVLRGQGRGESDEDFGSGLAVGDLDQDGVIDLVVYAQGGADWPHDLPGSISYCLGRVGGPSGCARLVSDHEYAFASDRSLAVGNMSGDSRPEIVFGVSSVHDECCGFPLSGRVLVLQLGGTPLQVVRQTTLTQDSRGVPGSGEDYDEFGSSVALGDIDRDGYADLAIGAVRENGNEGRVTVVHGAAAGWRTSGNYSYSQNTRGIPGTAERWTDAEGMLSGDMFGSDVSLRDHNRDGRLDLTVSAVGENDFSGAITTLRGSGHGFTTTGARTFGLATLRYPYPAEANFGAPLGSK